MITARSLAHQILLHLQQKAAYPDRLLRVTLSRHPRLDPRDRALVSELVYGVLRWQGRLDWHIDQLSNIRPNKISSPIRILLRMALYQLLFLDRIPSHAAVNEAVSLCKATQPEHLARFVNGVLREAVRRGSDWDWPTAEGSPIERLAVLHAHPIWFVKQCMQQYGPSETEALCAANNRPAPMAVRVNTLKATISDVLEQFGRAGIEATASPHLPAAVRLTGPRLDIGSIVPYRDGWVQIQDEASQLVGHLVSPKPGERVLDLCAGFGGKSTHLAILMGDEGEILAVDHSDWKLEDLRRNALRQGLSIIRTLAMDVMELDPGKLGQFDRVLLDAPCSGLGVLRRNPDIKWRRHPKDPYRFSRLQGPLLRKAAQLARPGGILVYATCTIFGEENESVARGLIGEQPGLVLEEAAPYLPGSHGEWTEGPYLRTWPHRHDMDGFFAARFRKME